MSQNDRKCPYVHVRRSVQVAEWLTQPTLDHKVPGLNLVGGGIQLIIVWHFIS